MIVLALTMSAVTRYVSGNGYDWFIDNYILEDNNLINTCEWEDESGDNDVDDESDDNDDDDDSDDGVIDGD